MAKWQALDNISLPRPGDATHQTDLVMRGETFDATDAQVKNLLHPKMGPPRIRKSTEASGAIPQLLPRAFSGPLRGPVGDARPDPVGSTTIQVAMPPEAAEPAPGSEEVDALDLPPGHRITAGV
ncbi:MAG TPA: hypothetical protein VGI66_03655 [Streptosporangiaceae bacterium]|jgi:hypothetical protein